MYKPVSVFCKERLFHTYAACLADIVLRTAGEEPVPLYGAMKPDWCGSISLNEPAQTSGMVVVAVGDENSVNLLYIAEIVGIFIFQLFFYSFVT